MWDGLVRLLPGSVVFAIAALLLLVAAGFAAANGLWGGAGFLMLLVGVCAWLAVQMRRHRGVA